MTCDRPMSQPPTGALWGTAAAVVGHRQLRARPPGRLYHQPASSASVSASGGSVSGLIGRHSQNIELQWSSLNHSACAHMHAAVRHTRSLTLRTDTPAALTLAAECMGMHSCQAPNQRLGCTAFTGSEDIRAVLAF